MIYMYDKNNPDQLNRLQLIQTGKQYTSIRNGFKKHVKEYYQNTEQELS